MHFLYTYSLGPKNSVKKDRLRQQKQAFQAWKSMVNMRPVTFRAITSKSQWIFTKVYMCINIVESCLVIAHGQISSIFDSYLPVFYILANYKEMKFKSLFGSY